MAPHHACSPVSLVLSIALLTGICSTNLIAQDEPARNGRFTVTWKAAGGDGPIRIRGEAKGILQVATQGDSATIRLEMTQRADGQPSNTVQSIAGKWRGDTLQFTQTVESQVNAAGQQMPMTAYSDWRVLIVGDELRGTVFMHKSGMNIDIPPLVVAGRREVPPSETPQPAAANASPSQVRSSASTWATSVMRTLY